MCVCVCVFVCVCVCVRVCIDDDMASQLLLKMEPKIYEYKDYFKQETVYGFISQQCIRVWFCFPTVYGFVSQQINEHVTNAVTIENVFNCWQFTIFTKCLMVMKIS